MSFKKLQMQAPNPIDIADEKSDEMNDIAQIFNASGGGALDSLPPADKTDEKPDITEDILPSSIKNTAKSPETSGLDSDLQTGGTAPDAPPPIVTDISVDNIVPSRHNKFEQYVGEKKEAMIDSIKENGIITPLTLRKTNNPDIYEIISGENRWRCAKEAGLQTVPANVIECDEQQAIMLLTEANLINRDISFRERIIAYRQQYDVMKSKSGERTDLQESNEKVNSLDILAKKYGESRTQMSRYVKVSDMSKYLIDMIGQKKIALDAAVKLTSLDENAQAVLANYLSDNSVKLKSHHADEILKGKDNLNFGSLDDIFESNNKQKKVKSIKTKRFARYFENTTDTNEIEETIEKALKMYFERISQESEDDEYTQCDEIE